MDDREIAVGYTGDQRTFLSNTASGQTLGWTQPPIQRLSAALYLRVKPPEQVSDHSDPSGPKIKNL
jgi:hypothetical protein